MKQYLQIVLHALLVGLISAGLVVLCELLAIKAWIAFFAWASFYLYGHSFFSGVKALIALSLGVFLGFAASQLLPLLEHQFRSMTELFIHAAVTLMLAASLVFMEYIEHWRGMLPASFLGIVVFFASGTSFSMILPGLLLPLLIGIVAGFVTILCRRGLRRLFTR